MWAVTKGWRSPRALSAACVLALLLAAVGLRGSSSSAAPSVTNSALRRFPHRRFRDGRHVCDDLGLRLLGSRRPHGQVRRRLADHRLAASNERRWAVVSAWRRRCGDVRVETDRPATRKRLGRDDDATYVAERGLVSRRRRPGRTRTSVHVRSSALNGRSAATVEVSATRTRLVGRDRHRSGRSFFTGTQVWPSRSALPAASRRRATTFLYVPAPTVTSVSPGFRPESRDRRHRHRHPFQRPGPCWAVRWIDQLHGRPDGHAGLGLQLHEHPRDLSARHRRGDQRRPRPQRTGRRRSRRGAPVTSPISGTAPSITSVSPATGPRSAGRRSRSPEPASLVRRSPSPRAGSFPRGRARASWSRRTGAADHRDDAGPQRGGRRGRDQPGRRQGNEDRRLHVLRCARTGHRRSSRREHPSAARS